MKNTIQLSVSSPCHENWDNFDQRATGRFCDSCNKVVIDFTTMSDEEIVHFFDQPVTDTCGRFRPHQLKAYTEKIIPPIRPGFALFKASALMLFMMLMSKQVSAQPLVTKANTELALNSIAGHEADSISTPLQIVRGVVKSSEDKSVLPGVNVVVKGTDQGTITDTNGLFELGDLREGDVLVFYFIGLETKEYKVRDIKNEPIEIELMLSMDIMGKVAVTGLYEPEPHGFAKLWMNVKKLF